MVSRCRTIVPSYSELTLGSAELEEVSLRILGVTLNSKFAFQTHLREIVSKAARSQGAVRQAGKLFDCQRVLKSLGYVAPVWMSSAESHLGLLDSIVRSAERLCEGVLCCLGPRRKFGALRLLYKIYYKVDHQMN